MDNDMPIYTTSQTCNRLFIEILNKSDAASILVAEVLHMRFNQWTSYLGVFAQENVSLDTRLQYSQSISQLVLQFLQIVSRNLERIGQLDEALEQTNFVGDDLQQSIAEEVNHVPESGASSSLAESLRAIKLAIDGLYRLGAAIRQSSSSTLNQRISKFIEENDDLSIENLVFLRLKHKFFDKDENKGGCSSPLSLYRQLATSISFRYFAIRYRQDRQDKIGKRREVILTENQTQEKKGLPQESNKSRKKGDPNELKKLVMANARINRQPETEKEDPPTTVHSKDILGRYAATENSFAQAKSVLSSHMKEAKYPDAPKVDTRTREANCPFCAKPIIEMDLRKKDWWHHHVDQDLKLYTCLSERCAEPPQFFIHFQEWKLHMDENHTTNWMREIHKPLRWCCDLEHDEHDDKYFEDVVDYDQHVQKFHPEYEAEKAELKEWGELQRERPEHTCPICGRVPIELAAIYPWLDEGRLAKSEDTEAGATLSEREHIARNKLLLHIGTHLKHLGLMSVAYFEDDAGDNPMESKRGSISINEEGEILFIADPPDYLDPGFDGYVQEKEPNALEDAQDWSKVRKLSEDNESADPDDDPILRSFRRFKQIQWDHPNNLIAQIGHFLVPFGRNESFIGREDILQQLITRINPGANRDDCQRTAVEGLGGVGKTQIALEVAFRLHDAHPDCSIFWVPAVEATGFENAYREIGQSLGVAGIDEDSADVKTLVKAALSRKDAGAWLLIVDNADDADLVCGPTGLLSSLPFSRMGSILFTTRNHQATVELDIPETGVFSIPEMSQTEATELLQRSLEESQTQDTASLTSLLDCLAYLPLAIKQASAYMAKTGIAISKYLQLCRSSDKNMIKLLSKDFEDRGRYRGIGNAVATTWLISFVQISRDYPLAIQYLRSMCFFAEKEIPASLLWTADDELEADEAIGALKAYAFITERAGQGLYDMHRLVRLAIHSWLENEGAFKTCVTATLHQLDKVFPYPEPKNRADWVQYLPHALTALQFGEYSTDNMVNSNLLFKVAWSTFLLGKYQDAESFYYQVLELWTKVLGAEHPNTLSSMNNLASVLYSQGKNDKAEAINRQVLELQTKVLGAEHPDTLLSMNNLASVLYSQRKYNEAEATHRQVLELQTKMLGAEHPDTLSSMNNLANVLYGQGKYDEAEAIYRQALELWTKVLGAEHPHTLLNINSLASVLYSQGKYNEAEATHRQVLELQTKMLGAEHHNTLLSMNNLASVLYSQGKYNEAEAIHRQALELWTKVLGAEHPHTLLSMNNLASVLYSQRKYNEAEAISRQVLELQTKMLGAEHPDTLLSMNNLAKVLERQGEYDEAEAIRTS